MMSKVDITPTALHGHHFPTVWHCVCLYIGDLTSNIEACNVNNSIMIVQAATSQQQTVKNEKKETLKVYMQM